jgi:hypothetical protein
VVEQELLEQVMQRQEQLIQEVEEVEAECGSIKRWQALAAQESLL